jgi:serine/threonine protein kinase
VNIGGYKVVRILGEGGAAVVYRCTDEFLRRDVALKLLKAGPSASERSLKRFRREAQALASLDHPNVVRVFAGGMEDEDPFLVLEFVEGRSLQELLDQDGPLPPRRALELIRDVASAVEHAHERGILHRDIKPANLLLDNAGRVRLADFGLSRIENDSIALHTLAGHLLGTPGFIGYEQATGRPDEMGPASDVFGLGATLYALLVGYPPFTGATLSEILMATIRGSYTPVETLVSDAPDELDEFMSRCLAEQPGWRYSSVASMRADIIALLAGEPLGPPPDQDEAPAPADVYGRLMDEELDEVSSDQNQPLPDELSRPTLRLSEQRHPGQAADSVPTVRLAGLPPPIVPESQDGLELVALARACFAQGDFAAAAMIFERAADVKEGRNEALLGAAVARRRMGDFQGAIRVYGRALSLDPEEARAYVGRAAARTDAEDFSGAVADFERALELLPQEHERVARIRVALNTARSRLGGSVIRGRRLEE